MLVIVRGFKGYQGSGVSRVRGFKGQGFQECIWRLIEIIIDGLIKVTVHKCVHV